MYWAGCNEWLIKGGQWWLGEALVVSCPSLSGRTTVQAAAQHLVQGEQPHTTGEAGTDLWVICSSLPA